MKPHSLVSLEYRSWMADRESEHDLAELHARHAGQDLRGITPTGGQIAFNRPQMGEETRLGYLTTKALAFSVGAEPLSSDEVFELRKLRNED